MRKFNPDDIADAIRTAVITFALLTALMALIGSCTSDALPAPDCPPTKRTCLV